MRKLATLTVATLLALSASGCIYVDGKHISKADWQEEQRINRELIAGLELGTSRTEVVSRLGTPAESEALELEGEEVQVLFYRTQRKHSDGTTTRDETTPLVFRNNKLVGWGSAAYEGLI